jgi:carbon-monoxide dehydrogenase medium subunit
MLRLPPFSYYEPASVEEAVSLLAEAGERGFVLAGGTDLVVDLKTGRVEAGTVVNVKRIDGLRGIATGSRGVRIGASTPVAAIERSIHVTEHVAALADAAAVLATPSVRRLATIGGNLGRASPASDLGPPLLVHDAVVEVAGVGGRRSIPIEDWYVGPGLTSLAAGEMITGVDVPASAGTGSAHRKIGTRSGGTDIALAGVAAALTLGADGTIVAARVALASVAPTPMRSLQAERMLTGGLPGGDLFAAAGREAAAECRPIDDVRASADHRRAVIPVLVERALAAAAERAGGAR